MFHHQARVLHDAHPGGAQSRGARVVADAELEPRRERQRVHREDLVDVRGQVLRRAEQVDEVHGLAQLAQARDAAFAQHRVELRRDRHDAMAVLLHVMRNLEGVVVRARLDADHRDRAAAIEDLTQAANRRRASWTPSSAGLA